MTRWTGFFRSPPPAILPAFPLLPPAVMRARAAIAEAAGQVPVLYGGVLRDIFHGEAFRDIDCAVCPQVTKEDFTAALVAAGFTINARSGLGYPGVNYGYGVPGDPLRRLKTVFEGLRVDIGLCNSVPDAETYATRGLEVSGSIAMNREGTVLAHPWFTAVDPRRTYALNPTRMGLGNWPSIYHRYQKFSARHGALEFRIGV